MKKWNTLTWGTLIGVACGLAACNDRREDEIPNGLTGKSNFRLSHEAGAIELDYEIETSRRTEVLSYGSTKANATDVIYNAPTVHRTAVKVKIMADGSFESESLEMAPTNDAFLPKHKSLPEPNGRYGRRVIKGNTMETFDAAGKYVGTQQVTIPNFQPLLDEISTAKTNAEENPVKPLNDVAGFGANTVLEMAKAKNAQIKTVSNTVKEVILDLHEPNSQGISSFRMTYLLDVAQNSMLSGKLYDNATGKLLSQTVYLYHTDKASGTKTIRHIYTETFHEDPKTARRTKTTTVDEYKKFVFTDNLN